MDKQSKIILISGPTASGKSNFALKLLKELMVKLLMQIVCKFIRN